MYEGFFCIKVKTLIVKLSSSEALCNSKRSHNYFCSDECFYFAGVFITYVDKQHDTSKFEEVFSRQFLIKCLEELSDVLICSKTALDLNVEDWKRRAKKLERTSKNDIELCQCFDDIIKIS